VIRQPCSRVAHTYRHLYEGPSRPTCNMNITYYVEQLIDSLPHQFSDSSVNNGVTQEQIDRNVLSVAELWLSPHQRETVFQSRFTNRIPYHVEVSLDSRQLSEFLNVKMLRDEKCQSFDWFLSEVYPGLEADRENVEIGYKNHLSSKYLETSLAPLVEQYNKAASGAVMDKDEIAKLIKREGTPAELAFKEQKGQAVPPVVKEIILSPFEKHSELIRDTLVCKDQPKLKPTDEFSPCEKSLQLDPNACTSMKSIMMFQCPQTCSMCGADGKICFDFYEHKCPEWAAEGQCVSEEAEMRKTCRVSCGFCSRQAPVAKVVEAVIPLALPVVKEKSVDVKVVEPDEAPGPGDVIPMVLESDAKDTVSDPNAEIARKDVLNHNLVPVMKEDLGHNVPPIMPEVVDPKVAAVAEAALALITTTRVVNPFAAQEQYKNGLLPDPPVGAAGACGLNDKSHGNLLAYMDLAVVDSSVPAPKILCGIYTMEKNHATNVQATRETWGKKCDGFIAFSTVDNDLIPSLNILHEGDEHYDNMWQKSRSIWKYINEHFVDSFDYFLLGGDDMFYVVENLKHYLMSAEITALSAKNTGIFLGRRFWPGNTTESHLGFLIPF
jgi:ShK domain-like